MSITQKILPASIAAGQSLSNGVLIGDYTLCGLLFPANWTGVGAISWQVSIDNGATWFEVNDDTGAPLSQPATSAVGKYYALNPANGFTAGLVLVKLRSGTQAAPVVQTNAVIVQVVTRRVYPGVG